LQHGAVFGVLGVGGRGAALQAHRVVAVVAGHRDVQALEIGEAATLDIAHRSKGQVRRVLVLLAARRLAGMAADAMVGVEVKTVLLVAVRVDADGGVFVDVQRAARRKLAFCEFDQVDLLPVSVHGRQLDLRQDRVGLLLGACLPDRARFARRRRLNAGFAGAWVDLHFHQHGGSLGLA
jgi:hypothetical protein